MPDGIEKKSEPYVRDWMGWIVMLALGIIGFGVNNRFLRLGARIRDLLIKFKLVRTVDAKNAPVEDAKWAGSLLAICASLGILLFGFHKSGLMGDACVGFGAGLAIDEVLALGVV
jgi:hypothetical protein